MTTLVDGLNLRLNEILNGTYSDIHGHEIIFEKTGNLEYSSVFIINCNRKFVIDISSVIVTINEVAIPDKEVLYNDVSNANTKHWNKNQILP